MDNESDADFILNDPSDYVIRDASQVPSASGRDAVEGVHAVGDAGRDVNDRNVLDIGSKDGPFNESVPDVILTAPGSSSVFSAEPQASGDHQSSTQI